MTLTSWLFFAAISALAILTPGQTVLFVISHTLVQGMRGTARMALGVMIGNTVAMTVCFAGLGTLLVASEQAFLVLRWVGATYLAFLGVKLWLVTPRIIRPDEPSAFQGRKLLSQAFFLMVLNPNALTFFIALAPQFIDESAPLLPQLAMMEATFVLLSGVNVFFYAMAADALRNRIGNPIALKWINRAAAVSLISIGLFAVASGPASVM